ncbi:MAG: rhomboid family intramembrane serine protease [Planctomycetaceae bacterium]
MFPLRDNIPSSRVPVVNYGLIACCALVFFLQMGDPGGELIQKFGMIPLRVSHPDESITVEMPQRVSTPLGPQIVTVQEPLPAPAFRPWTTLLSCVFLHGSLMHLIGNMWFLYIFGDNVEDRLGSSGYLVFFLGCGIAASFAHYALEPDSPVPTIGASGAVAGVMGAYMVLYPHGQVLTLVPIFFFLQFLVIPAPVFLGIWFVLQLVQGTFSMGNTQAAGVAWWAHVGGFAAGAAVALLLGRRPEQTARARVQVIDPNRRTRIFRR